jgi:hypothetical protein
MWHDQNSNELSIVTNFGDICSPNLGHKYPTLVPIYLKYSSTSTSSETTLITYNQEYKKPY